MKLVTWNVNGLRAALGKGLIAQIESLAPDVVCLQEIKARPEQLLASNMRQLEASYPYQWWRPAERPGYSGVATLARLAPEYSRLGLDKAEFDCEGRLIGLRFPDFWLFNGYFPHGKHDHSRVPFKLSFYAHLLELCDALHARGESVIICGDINTAHQEIDLRHPKANENTSGFLPEERRWVSHYLEHGFVDAYRQRYPQRVQYTWWTYRMNARQRNVGWRLDYFLVSKNLFPRVKEVTIHEDIAGSDHCPVSLELA